MAVPETPRSLINGWAERIAVTLLDQQAWFRHALTHGELQILTGLNGLQVSRGCWHGRLHGLLSFEPSTGQVRYTLTPLGVAIARRLKSAASEGEPPEGTDLTEDGGARDGDGADGPGPADGPRLVLDPDFDRSGPDGPTH